MPRSNNKTQKNNNNNNNVCPICLDEMTNNNSISLRCHKKHKYHKQCARMLSELPPWTGRPVIKCALCRKTQTLNNLTNNIKHKNMTAAAVKIQRAYRGPRTKRRRNEKTDFMTQCLKVMGLEECFHLQSQHRHNRGGRPPRSGFGARFGGNKRKKTRKHKKK